MYSEMDNKHKFVRLILIRLKRKRERKETDRLFTGVIVHSAFIQTKSVQI